jgi:hypothetical protein
MKLLCALLLLCVLPVLGQKSVILDEQSKEPVSFATISFGDGRGTFAGEDGGFLFTKKKYADIDSLFISAIGYQEKGIATADLPLKILLSPETNFLSEVIVSAPKKGKFKTKKLKAETHQDINACWLPTVESEVAVLFKRIEGKSSKIAKLLLPVNAEAQYKSKGKGKVSTVFRIQFYENSGGKPGLPFPHEKIVFLVSDEEDKVFELDILSKRIFIPENGIFASLQVMGYADKEGKLAQSKKYREIKTRAGIKKISTAFRPLLPFSNDRPQQKTFVRRVFLNNKKWQVFDERYNENSNLIQGNHRNYAMGAVMHVYQE